MFRVSAGPSSAWIYVINFIFSGLKKQILKSLAFDFKISADDLHSEVSYFVDI